MKNNIASLLIAGALIGGALYYTAPEQERLVKKVTNTMTETVSANVFLSQNNDEERIIIDVRTPAEYEAGHMEGAKNIDISSANFIEEINTLDKSSKYSVYCRSGNRSGQALSLMQQIGFENVIDLDGGIVAWSQIGGELCTEC